MPNNDLPDNWIRVGDLFNSMDEPKKQKRKGKGPEYLEAILDTMRKLLPEEVFRKIHALALPRAGGRANANRLEKLALEEITPTKLTQITNEQLHQLYQQVNVWFKNAKEAGRAIENYINAAKFLINEFKGRNESYDTTLPVARAADRLSKSIEDAAVTREDLKDLPDEVMIVPDFVSVVGSSVRSSDPHDVDILYRADINDKGDFIVSWENIYLAMRNTLKMIKPDLDMHEIFNPQGSREEQWLPIYHMVLRKSKNDLRLVKGAINPEESNQQISTTPPGVIEDFNLGAPSMPNWENYLNDVPPEGIWADIGCGSTKAKKFIGIDKELYPGVDMKADLCKGIPLTDSCVSVIRANHFIEHMPDFKEIMDEVGRVLVDGGICIMTMPSTDGAGARIHPDHKIFMNKTEFENQINDLELFDPVIIQERHRENGGLECVDIDAVLRRKDREVKVTLPLSRNGLLNTKPFQYLAGIEKIAKITPGVKFIGMKPSMAGYTESFDIKDLAKWADGKYPIDIEQKLNGNRSFISKKGTNTELWYEGQMGTSQLNKFPDIREILDKIPEDFVIDMDLGLERSGKRVIRQDLMIFNADEPKLESNEIPVITVFDILFRGNKDTSKNPWTERRDELESFYKKYLSGKKNFDITSTKIVNSDKGLKTATRWAFGFPMSEGLVAKEASSPYQQGGSSYWYKLKKIAELKLIVISKKKTKAGANVYEAGLTPSRDEDLNSDTKELNGKTYVSMGNTLATTVVAKLGDIITVQILELVPDYEKKTLAWIGPRVQDLDDTRKEPYSVSQALDISDRAQLLQKRIKNMVPSSGSINAAVAFVGSSPGKIDAVRGEPLVGSSGETFNELYLKPLKLKRDQVFITNAVPKLLLDEDGNVREPSDDEVAEWHEWLFNELDSVNPKVVVALGRTAKKALNGEADIVMPHPMAVRRFGNSGEVGRKIKQVITKIIGVEKDTITPGDVHIDNTNWKVPKTKRKDSQEVITEMPDIERDWLKPDTWRRFAKADEEGGETRGEASETFWNNNWQDMYPLKGKGEFVFQHHWRGLDEDESKLPEDELLKTDHSVHGDLRFTARDGKSLWGFSVFIGTAADNKEKERLINLPPDDNLQGTFKLEQPKEWLTIARSKPHIGEPGEPGSTSQTYSKFFEEDHGTYEIGVWKQHLIEIFFNGDKLKGRYLIEFAPIGGKRIWIIDHPDNDTPLAETKDIQKEIKDQKQKGREYLIWSKPGEKPIPIKLSGAKKDGFIMADDLIDAIGEDESPWEAYEEISKEVNKGIYVDIVKADDDKQLVYGVVLEPDGVDAQNDTVSKAEIENAAHIYLKDSRTVGDSHKEKAKASVVESYIAPVDFKLGGQEVKEGTWVMVVRINDTDMWKKVRAGEYTGFSIGGFSKRIPVPGPVQEKQIPYEQPAPGSEFPASMICY